MSTDLIFQQIDLVPSLSLLLGHPIPYGSLGMIIPNLFEFDHNSILENCKHKEFYDMNKVHDCYHILSHDRLSYSYLLNSLQVMLYILDYFENIQFNRFNISNPILLLSHLSLPNLCQLGTTSYDTFVRHEEIKSPEIRRLHSRLRHAIILHEKLLQFCPQIRNSDEYLALRHQVHQSYSEFLSETLAFARYFLSLSM